MMPDVIPMDHFGVAPSKDGSLNSRLASLVDQEIYYQYVMRMSLQAEFTLSNPPLVTQTRVDAAALPTDERQIDFYQDDEFEQEQQRGIYRRDRATVKHVQDHFQQSYASSNTPHVKEKLGEFNNPLENNVRPLPHGHTVATYTLPNRNPKLAEIVRDYQVSVSATYGIPRSLVAQDVSVRTAGAFELVETAMRSNLAYWNGIGGQLLTAIYRCIYYPEDCNWVANVLPQKKEEMTVEELFEEASKIADVRIIIPLGIRGDVKNHRELFDQGVITWQEYVQAARSIYGFGSAEMPEPKEPTEPEEPKEPTSSVEKKTKTKDTDMKD
jgi:hypothetical protein